VSISRGECYKSMSVLLNAWSKLQKDQRQPQASLTRLFSGLWVANPGSAVRDALVGAANLRTFNLHEQVGWLRGPPILDGAPIMWPIATVYVGTLNGVVSASVRVALLSEPVDGSDDCLGEGWRFDEAEKAGAAHPYVHAQRIRSLASSSPDTLLPKELPVILQARCNESRPAFPLRGAESCVGMVAAMIASLHGACVLDQIRLAANPSLHNQVHAREVAAVSEANAD
jgi:hypothetical protein